MDTYEPDRPPEPAAWLQLDEQERIDLVAEHHAHVADDLPNVMLHCMMHAVIETQLASGDPPGVSRTLSRLLAAGVSRHEALHAIGAVLAELMHSVATGGQPGADPNVLYERALERIDPSEWVGP